jgi:hypothetical protein
MKAVYFIISLIVLWLYPHIRLKCVTYSDLLHNSQHTFKYIVYMVYLATHANVKKCILNFKFHILSRCFVDLRC